MTAGPNEADTTLIRAHKTEIQKLEFSHDLKFIASAAKDSSVIRIFRVEDSSLFREIRKQYCIDSIVNFNFDVNFLSNGTITEASQQESSYLLMSDKMGNVEIFYIKDHLDDKG